MAEGAVASSRSQAGCADRLAVGVEVVYRSSMEEEKSLGRNGMTSPVPSDLTAFNTVAKHVKVVGVKVEAS